MVLLGLRLDSAEPIFRVLDLNVDEVQQVTLHDGKRVTVHLQAVDEKTDPSQRAVREATVEVSINGKRTRIGCGNYELPKPAGAAQVDCTVTSGYKANSTTDHWGLEKRARVRLWPAKSPWMQEGEFGFPLRQK